MPMFSASRLFAVLPPHPDPGGRKSTSATGGPRPPHEGYPIPVIRQVRGGGCDGPYHPGEHGPGEYVGPMAEKMVHHGRTLAGHAKMPLFLEKGGFCCLAVLPSHPDGTWDRKGSWPRLDTIVGFKTAEEVPDMTQFEFTYRDDADEPPGVNSGDDAGVVSDDPTEPATLVETELTDPTDGAWYTDTSGTFTSETFHLFSTQAELLALSDWGNALRLANFRRDRIRLTTDQARRCIPLLLNLYTGMWRMQGNPHFQSLFDVTLSEANEEALEFAEKDPTISNRSLGRLRKYIEASGGGSVSKVMRQSARLADDPCVPIDQVDPSSLNRVDRYPVLLCGHEVVSLTDGGVVNPADLQDLFLLDMTSAPTAFVRDAANSEAPGAVMMHRFLRFLGNGDETMPCQRLGWQLCGHHSTIDVIAGDYDGLSLLGRALQDTLGPSVAQVLSMGRGAVRPQHIADSMEQARLSLWTGADTAKTIPVWELHALVSHVEPRRQGNLILLVADWPSDWDTLDHRIARRCGWAWRVQGSLTDQGIDPEVMLNQDGRQFLLAKLVEGATHGYRQFHDTKKENGVGDPSLVAANDYSRACAEELQIAGADPHYRTLYRALRFTDDARDAMTQADIEYAITAMGEDPIPHNGVGKIVPRLWPGVEVSRPRIDGEQKRVIRRIAPQVHDSDLPESFD